MYMMPLARWVAAVALGALIVVVAGGPYDGGSLVAVNSFDAGLYTWNSTSNASFVLSCQFPRTIFTPGYTVDAQSRTFYYLYRFFEQSRLAAWPYEMQSNGSMACGVEKTICQGQWDTNQTAALYYDAGLDQFIMVDERLTPGEKDEYISRVWRFDATTCTPELVVEHKIAPYLLRSVDSYMYDAANHRFYSMYLETIEGGFRLRSVDMSADLSDSVVFDMYVDGDCHQEMEKSRWSERIQDMLGIQPLNRATLFGAFDPATGYINALFLEGEHEYKTVLIDPTTCQDTCDVQIPHGVIDQSGAPRWTTDIVIDWRNRLLVTQRPVFNSTNYNQFAFNMDDGFNKNATFLFDNYVDYGWQYDPVITVKNVNINTATQQELLDTLPGISSQDAASIVAARPFNVVEGLKTVNGITPQEFAAWRPYTSV